MSTTLLTLRGRLQDLLGDKNQAYSEYYNDAINNAIREVYPNLYEAIDDQSLITGNILPPFNWTSTSALQLYTTSSCSLTKTTTGGLYRNTPSAKVTASSADGYLYLDSNNYRRLLDLMNQTIDFKCWAYPEVADDAFLTIYTLKADGTTQTLNSTTSCPATKFTLLSLESQDINDDIVQVQFRLRVHTNAKYIYFDAPRVTGFTVYEYLLPYDLQFGQVDEVYVQSSGYSDDVCDDLFPSTWERVWGWDITNDGTYKYLRLPYAYSSERRIRLVGRKPLDTLAADTDTINIDDEGYIQLLLRYAAYLVYEMQADGVGTDDITRYERAAQKQLAKYYELVRAHGQPPPRKFINRSLS